MSIRQCRAVRAIADHGSFAAAARRLNITQSAISMQVTSFEERLGVTLFDRTHRPPRLTEAGRLVLAHARAIVGEYDAMLEALSEDYAHGGALRIGVIPTVLTSLLPAALMVLRNRGATAPTVTVTSALSGDLATSVEHGELDAALIHRPKELRPGLVWREIKRQKIVVIAPGSTREPDLATLFAAQPYIRFNRAAWVAPLIERRLKEMGLEPNTTAELQSIDAIRLLVGLGFGFSIIPSVTDGADDPSLRMMEFGDPPLYRTIGFVMHASLAERPVARIVGDAFEKAAHHQSS
ncbi:LysR family transcriptional regulator [Afifella pfennigii]|uniref:LysR family transcriptional regulator n=1 Tax=Afifella pfennigii TaxID=209897 RepID=UPI00068A412D|nr:LysR family transcriptional regulator [Afifella pfennigii]